MSGDMSEHLTYILQIILQITIVTIALHIARNIALCFYLLK